MAIKSIHFNTDGSVRAILDGRKTCTRRICKDANEYTVPDMEFYDADKRTYAVHNFADLEHTEKLSIGERTCPICPEDILYVRETFYEDEDCILYKADNEKLTGYRNMRGEDIVVKWRPSIHMPKDAARIWLKVTDVRVERLQEITPENAVKEGTKEIFPPLAVDEFWDIWNATIKKSDLERYGWNANPWVWVIEFERCEKPKVN